MTDSKDTQLTVDTPPPSNAAAIVARNDEAEYDGPTVTLPTALVVIKKKTNEIPREVPHHEVPVLRAMHGPDAIKVENAAYGTVTFPDDPAVELARLKNKYDRNGSQIVLSVYGTPSAIAAVTGMDLMAGDSALLEQGTSQAQASVVIDPKASERGKAAQKAIAATRGKLADKKKKA